MRRSAFTWIELIFVIIVLGILAATAIVKMGGMSDRANEVKLDAMVGSLNRSSGAGFWFKSISDGNKGSVANSAYSDVFDQYMELVPGYSYGPLLENCNTAGTGILLKYQYTDAYEVHCKDGSTISSPEFRLYNRTQGTYFD